MRTRASYGWLALAFAGAMVLTLGAAITNSQRSRASRTRAGSEHDCIESRMSECSPLGQSVGDLVAEAPCLLEGPPPLRWDAALPASFHSAASGKRPARRGRAPPAP
jgi:hypothetical protein